MTLRIIHDADAMAAVQGMAAAYAAAFARHGTRHFIANATSRMALLAGEGAALPVTVDDGGYGRSYVASPHSAYALYAREELDIVGMRRGRTAARAALSVADRLLHAVQFNRAVHLDNWMLSTNLHGEWTGNGLTAMRRMLTQHCPDHFLILRSLDSWGSAALLDAAKADGWILVPARQIWVVDDLRQEWRGRSDYGNDRRALARSGLRIEDVTQFPAEDCARVAQLYAMLYIDRYSSLNPRFTEDFVAMTQASGAMAYRVARDPSGQIMSVAGMLERGGIMTPSIVGYDTGRPQSEALYRIATFMFCDWAMERGFALHGSAGAAHFKRQRGAHGVIEYMAVFADHLPVARRSAVKMLAQILERFAVPMMQREGW